MPTICLVVQGVYDVDARVRRKAGALVAAGYAVDVLALRPSGGAAAYILDGVSVRTLNLGKRRGSLLRYAFEYSTFFLWALLRISGQMLRRRYVAVDINTLPDFLVFAAVFAKWMGATVILDMHEITPEFYMSKYRVTKGHMAIRLLTFIEKRSCAFADHVITITEPIQELLVGRGLARAKSTVVMNAVDEGRFLAAPQSALPATDTSFVMMYHGTLTRIYGLDIAVEAFAMARDEMPGAEFWILGSGPALEPLRQQVARLGVESHVKLVGQVPSSDIPQWLRKIDAGVLPIRRDVFLDFAFPNKLPEFIVNGKAVIVSRLKTIRHYFSESALAYFEPNNPADLAAQMISIYRDPVLRRSKAAVAVKEYAPITWDIMRDRYLGVVKMSVATREHIAAVAS